MMRNGNECLDLTVECSFEDVGFLEENSFSGFASEPGN